MRDVGPSPRVNQVSLSSETRAGELSSPVGTEGLGRSFDSAPDVPLPGARDSLDKQLGSPDNPLLSSSRMDSLIAQMERPQRSSTEAASAADQTGGDALRVAGAEFGSPDSPMGHADAELVPVVPSTDPSPPTAEAELVFASRPSSLRPQSGGGVLTVFIFTLIVLPASHQPESAVQLHGMSRVHMHTHVHMRRRRHRLQRQRT